MIGARLVSDARRSGPRRFSRSCRGDHVTFARHDVTLDAPLTHVDLVSCQHVLMYMDRSLQDRVIGLFQYALRPRGFLALAPTEATFVPGLDRVHAQASLYRNDPPSHREHRLPDLRRRVDTSHSPGPSAIGAVHEELICANEQLHTALEELHTAKQELGSVRAELRMAAEESRERDVAIHELSRELAIVLGTSDIPMVVLDREHRIVRFTPALSRLFNIRSTDTGRAISDLTHRLGSLSLAPLVQRVLAEDAVLEQQLRDVAGRWFLMRITRVPDGGGVVATFVDVSSVKRATDEPYRALARTSARVLFRMSPDWRLMREIDSAGLLVDAPGPMTNWMDVYIEPSERYTVRAAVNEAISTKRVFDLEHRVICADGSSSWVRSRAVPLLDPNGDIYEWVGTAHEISRGETEVRS